MRKILSDKDIVDIKDLYHNKGLKQRVLAEKYKCSIMTISLWIQPDPQAILRKKKRVAIDYSGQPRCKVCGRILKEEGGFCDCRTPKKYYNDLDNLNDIYNENISYKG